MATWRDLILEEAGKHEESLDDMILVFGWNHHALGALPSEPLTKYEILDLVFDAGYGATEGYVFTGWTENRVYFPGQYDGSEWCASVPRNPCDVATEHIGWLGKIMTKTVITVLINARDLVAKGWTQGCAARNKEGEEIGAAGPHATHFCPLGSIIAVSDNYGPLYGAAYWLFRACLPNFKLNSISKWNDHSDRTQADVVAMFNKAISRGEVSMKKKIKRQRPNQKVKRKSAGTTNRIFTAINAKCHLEKIK